MTNNKYDVIIIGGGPAGLSAAIYLARYKLKALILDASPGGLAKEAHKVENYPGFESISGLELMKKIRSHSNISGANIVNQNVSDVKKENNEFIVSTDQETYKSDYIIIATGSKRQKLDIPGEKELYGRGVSYCATCDAAFFKEKVVAVVGGANSAVMAAMLIAEYASKVYLIYRKSELRAEPVWNDRAIENPKIEIIFNTNVTEVVGEKRVEKIKLDSNKSMDVGGLFIEIGSLPSIEIAHKLEVDMDSKSHIIVSSEQRTNIDNVYAAGDVTTGSGGFQQIVTALSEGSIAAYDIFKRKNKKKEVEYS